MNSLATKDTWNDEAVATLKRLWAEGMSAGQIGGVLGLSRNAIIGKINRLKLPKRTAAAIRAANRAGMRQSLNAGPSVRSQPRRGRTGGAGQSSAAAIVHRVEVRRATVVIPEEREEGNDVSHLIGIMDLRDDTCRFPIGDPLEPNFGFCGAHVPAVPEGQRRPPYCEHHQRRSRIRL